MGRWAAILAVVLALAVLAVLAGCGQPYPVKRQLALEMEIHASAVQTVRDLGSAGVLEAEDLPCLLATLWIMRESIRMREAQIATLDSPLANHPQCAQIEADLQWRSDVFQAARKVLIEEVAAIEEDVAAMEVWRRRMARGEP